MLEALCFGWIDSKANSLDDERYRLWMAPRKPESVWSAVNKQRIDRLLDAGLHHHGRARHDRGRQGRRIVERPRPQRCPLGARRPGRRPSSGTPGPARTGTGSRRACASRSSGGSTPPSARRPGPQRVEQTASLAALNERANQPRPITTTDQPRGVAEALLEDVGPAGAVVRAIRRAGFLAESFPVPVMQVDTGRAVGRRCERDFDLRVRTVLGAGVPVEHDPRWRFPCGDDTPVRFGAVRQHLVDAATLALLEHEALGLRAVELLDPPVRVERPPRAHLGREQAERVGRRPRHGDAAVDRVDHRSLLPGYRP